MERRPYFIFGDLLVCAVCGGAAGWLAHHAVPSGWPLPVGMIAGMVIGMLVGMLAGAIGGTVFSPLFGALEISLPAALAGMMAGAVTGMWQGMAGIAAGTALWAGAAIGIACLGYTYILQARLGGEAR